MSTQVVWLIVAVLAFSFMALLAILAFVSSEKTEMREAERRLRADQIEMAKLKTFHETGRR